MAKKSLLHSAKLAAYRQIIERAHAHNLRVIGVIVMLYAYVFPQLIPHGLNFIH